MTQQSERVTHKRGHNALVTGAGILLLGFIVAILGNGGGATGVGVLLAVAGLVTSIIGFGMRREN